ncbi:MAG: FkbM family methyltransferase [Geminicoccaceae bacterium]
MTAATFAKTFFRDMALTVPAIRKVYDERNALMAERHQWASEISTAHDERDQAKPAGPISPLPIPHWWERSFWEPTVMLAIRDHCRPGDVVYDVGTNAGAMAQAMSRLVGPQGHVFAFEASPRIIGIAQHNLVQHGCANVTLLHRAVWRASGETVSLSFGSHLNDRVDVDAEGVSVPTLALDDLAAATGMRPRFIKMDIEGAEFDALCGMPRLLDETRPILVLEQSPDDPRCFELLKSKGYRALDLASYRAVDSAGDMGPAGVLNMLFAPQELKLDGYLPVEPLELIQRLERDQFAHEPDGSLTLAQPIQLPKGRYLFRADFVADGTDNEIFTGVIADGEVIFRYHTFTKFMADAYRDWVVQLEKSSLVGPYLTFVRGRDPSLDWRGVDILRVPGFENWQAPIVE